MNLISRRLMVRGPGLPLAISLIIGIASTARAEITPRGRQLSNLLDAMHVDELWLPGGSVAWKTGQPLNRPAGKKPHTHCSAFVAAACARLNVYILSPPEHSTVMLANAQYDWLGGRGSEEGWQRVSNPVEAQEMANRGLLVVATYKERGRPGHIAIVRPCDKSIAAIMSEGPQIIQAGMTNYESTGLATGFRRHPAAWRDQQVRFYYHEIFRN
jgi:hypothetical protein